MRTRLTELLEVEHPIVQAPVGSAAAPALAAAVSEAGGLGQIALSWTAPERVGEAVAAVRALTARSFAANILLEWSPASRIDAALDALVPVISLAWGDPGEWVALIHDGGALALATVGSAEEAWRAEAVGCDAIVAQGWEAGGHVWGEVSTIALVPAVRDAVSVPVIAAGGIADGRGVAAALALGADGAWIGTRFLLAEETPIHIAYRERLLAACEADTVHVRDLFHVGWEEAPHRVLRNSTVEGWEASGRPPIGARPSEGETIASRPDGTPVVRYSSALPLEGMTGDVEALSLWAGQGVGLARRVQPAAEIVRELVEGAERRLCELAG